MEALRHYAEVARLRYDNGYTSYIEVLDAERSLFDADTQLYPNAGQALPGIDKSLQGNGRRLGHNSGKSRRDS